MKTYKLEIIKTEYDTAKEETVTCKTVLTDEESVKKIYKYAQKFWVKEAIQSR